MTRRVEDVAPQIRSLFVLGSPSALTDAQLLGRFAAGDGEASGLAFEALMGRHGPMVLRVCRGVLRDPHDAQDAFQATFLVLVRKANSIRDRDSVASWLHGVALRVSHHARAADARRRRLEREEGERIGLLSMEQAVDDLGPRLHEEVGRLPERYREAVVLCYLEGHTCEDAARVLRWPVGTVKSRLARARERLRVRLTRLGLAPSSALEVPTSPRNLNPLPPSLARATAEAASRFGARSAAPASALDAFALAEGVLTMMSLARWKVPACILMATALGLGVASALPVQGPKAEVGQAAKDEPPPQAPARDPIALTVPSHLAAEAGRGTALLYARDAKGERLSARGAAKADEDPAKADAARKEILGKAEVALKAGDPMALERAFAEAKALIEPAPPRVGPWLEVESDLRWVAITGILDNQAIREAEARARKIDLSEAYPQYKRVDNQRQVRSPEGDWSDWKELDYNKNYEVLDNLPEASFERTPEEFRPPALVDPLPFLKKGTWSGVDPEALLRLPVLRPFKAPIGGRPVGGMMGQAPTNAGPRYGSPLLMIRSLDFTAEPGKTYRYRTRVVVVNPDLEKDERKEFLGPWSEPTRSVAVP